MIVAFHASRSTSATPQRKLVEHNSTFVNYTNQPQQDTKHHGLFLSSTAMPHAITTNSIRIWLKMIKQPISMTPESSVEDGQFIWKSKNREPYATGDNAARRDRLKVLL
jgi:hypothetical protein